jgi:DUF971 family protein
LDDEQNVCRLREPAAELFLSDHEHLRPDVPMQGSEQGNEALRSANGATLDVRLDTGAAFSLLAQRLRAACRCAPCRRAQIDGVFPDDFPSVTITHVAPIGHYAVNLEFSDGHTRGIYPWSYLAELASDGPP